MQRVCREGLCLTNFVTPNSPNFLFHGNTKLPVCTIHKAMVQT